MGSMESLKFIKAQFKKLLTDKWDEGLRTKKDPGEEYVIYWVEHNAPEFRQKWDRCLCKNCSNVFECGFKEASECNFHFIEQTKNNQENL